MTTLGHHLVRGTAWSAAGKYSQYVVLLGVSSVLARLSSSSRMRSVTSIPVTTKYSSSGPESPRHRSLRQLIRRIPRDRVTQ